MRRRDEAPANWEPPPLGTEIDDGRSFGPSRREAPSQFRKLIRSVCEPPNHRSLISGPDVLARLQMRSSLGPSDRNTGLAEGGEVIAIRNVVAEVVAHDSRAPRYPANLLKRSMR